MWNSFVIRPPSSVLQTRMSFLAPLFLLGAAAIALPVLFHLIRRTSREKQIFSSLMFLAPTPPRVTRRSRLENLLLLILRCCIIALLATAFARPFLRKPPAATAREARRAVLLLDTSASMRRDGVWDDALAKATDLANQFTAGDQLAILAFDRQTRALLSFAEWNSASDRAALAGQRLRAAQPTWAATQLGIALVTASELLDQDRNATGPREIFLVSDLQEGAHLDGLQGFNWPKNSRVSISVIKCKRPSNAGVRILPEPPNATTTAETVKLRVSNNGESKHEQLQLRWENTTNSLAVYVPPGQSRTVELPKPAAAARAILSGDDSDFDNSVFHVPARRELIEVLYLGDATNTDPQRMAFYLQRAFPETARQSVAVTQPAVGQSLPANSRAQLLVLDGPLAEPRLGEVAAAIRAGKSALLPLAAASGAELLASITGLRITAEEAPTSGYAMLGEIDFTHPLFVPFADARFSDFTKIHFWKHRKLTFDASTAARVIARFDNGDPALVQFNVGRGSVFALASGWQPSDSQLALSSKFVPLLYSLLELSGGIKAPVISHTVGDAVDLAAVTTGSLPPATPLSIRKPDGTTATLPANETRFVPDMPGLHTVLANPPLEFAANLAPEESRTTPLAVEELQRMGVPVNATGAIPPDTAGKKRAAVQSTELEGRQKLWRWLIAVTLLVLMVETWIAARLSRRAAVPTGATP